MEFRRVLFRSTRCGHAAADNALQSIGLSVTDAGHHRARRFQILFPHAKDSLGGSHPQPPLVLHYPQYFVTQQPLLHGVSVKPAVLPPQQAAFQSSDPQRLPVGIHLERRDRFPWKGAFHDQVLEHPGAPAYQPSLAPKPKNTVAILANSPHAIVAALVFADEASIRPSA